MDNCITTSTEEMVVETQRCSSTSTEEMVVKTQRRSSTSIEGLVIVQEQRCPYPRLVGGALSGGGGPDPRESSSYLDNVMKALKDDPNECKVTMRYNHVDEINASKQLEKIKRRCERDNLFGAIVMVTVNKNPNLREIQHQIADKLGIRLEDDHEERKEKVWYCFGSKKKEAAIISENAKKITEAIHNQVQRMNVLFILSNLHESLDLKILGIPVGAGCKIIFTSESEEVLYKQRN